MKIFNKEDINKRLPHRGPMSLVNQISLDDDGNVIGTYTFQGDEWFFQGHYPNFPIVPGVILCEIMAQSACGVIMEEIQGKLPYLVGINNTKFRHIVKPKDTVHIKLGLTDRKAGFIFVSCKAFLNDQDIVCAEGDLIFCIKGE